MEKLITYLENEITKKSVYTAEELGVLNGVLKSIKKYPSLKSVMEWLGELIDDKVGRICYYDYDECEKLANKMYGIFKEIMEKLYNVKCYY